MAGKTPNSLRLYPIWPGNPSVFLVSALWIRTGVMSRSSQRRPWNNRSRRLSCDPFYCTAAQMCEWASGRLVANFTKPCQNQQRSRSGGFASPVRAGDRRELVTASAFEKCNVNASFLQSPSQPVSGNGNLRELIRRQVLENGLRRP